MAVLAVLSAMRLGGNTAAKTQTHPGLVCLAGLGHFLSPVIPSQYPSPNTSRIKTRSIQFTAYPYQLMSIAARTAVPTLRVMSICTLMRPELARATRTIASAVRNDMYCASQATNASSSTA